MIARPLALALAALGLAGGAAFAHHGWGSYEAGKKFTISSPVAHLMWQNPHVHIHVTHQGATWEAVLAPPFRMEARGLSPALITAGRAVQVEGHSSPQTAGEMRADRLVVVL